MSYAPIAAIIPQYDEQAGFYLKFYIPSTTTPISMATDSTGATLLAKCQLDNDGFPTTDGAQLFIPHVNKAYDAYLFPSAALADANDTTYAKRVALNNLPVNTLPDDSYTPSFVNIAALKLSDLGIGQTVTTKGFNTSGDGGGATYSVIDSSGVTANDYDRILLASGNIAKLVHDGSVSVLQFGAVGDGATDDYLNLKAANLSDAGTIRYPAKVFKTTATVPFASFKRYVGVYRQTEISSETDNAPVAASIAWLTSDGATAPTGQCQVENILFRGVKTNTGQKAFILHDYFSLFRRCAFVSCGGGGLAFTKENQDGTSAGGSLVENRVYECESRNCGGILFELGEEGNAKLTDGYMRDCIADGEVGLTIQHLHIGQAAGWIVDGLHVYGSASEIPLNIVAPNSTKVINLYIESFIRRAVALANAQGNVKISGAINASSIDDANGDIRYVSVGRSGATPDINVNCDLDITHKNSPLNATALYLANSGISGTLNLTKRSDDNNTVSQTGGSVSTYDEDISVVSNFKTTPDGQSGKLINGNAFPLCYTSGRLSGDASQSIDFRLSKLTGSAKMTLDLNIVASNFDGGTTVRAQYKALIMVTGKVGDDTDITVSEILAPTGINGFSSNPSFALVNADTDTPTLRTTFAFADVSATGVVTAIAVPVQAST